MQLDTFILADAVATPPDGKFYIQGGGLSRYEVPTLPWPIILAALVRLRMDENDLRRPHHYAFTLIGPTGQPNIPAIEVDHSVGKDELRPLLPDEERFIHVAVNLTGMAVRVGLYRLEAKVDDDISSVVSFPLTVTEETTSQGVSPAAMVASSVRPAAGARETKQKSPPPPGKKRSKRH